MYKQEFSACENGGFGHKIRLVFSDSLLHKMRYVPRPEMCLSNWNPSFRDRRAELIEQVVQKIRESMPQIVDDRYPIFIDFCVVGHLGDITHTSATVTTTRQVLDVIKNHFYDSFVKSAVNEKESLKHIDWNSKNFEDHITKRLQAGGVQMRLVHGFFIDESSYVVTEEHDYTSVAEKVYKFRLDLQEKGHIL